VSVASGATLVFTDTSTNTDTVNAGTLGNAGTIDIGTTLATATVTIEGEDAAGATNAFTNSHQVTIASGSQLTLTDVDLINTNGTVTVVSGATLVFTDATGTDTVNAGTLDNLGTVDIGTALATATVTIESEDAAGATNAFTNSGQVTIASGSQLTLTDVDLLNTNGTVTVDSGATLVFTDTSTNTDTVNAGTLDNLGIVDIGTTSATATVTIENENSGSAVGSFNNAGSVTIASGSQLTLDNVDLANAGGTVLVDATGELDLKGSTIDQGVVTNKGELKAATGTDTLSNLTLGNFTNNSTIEVASGATLVMTADTLTNGIAGVNGTVLVDATGALNLEAGSTIDEGTVKVDGTLKAVTGTDTLSNLGAGSGTGSFSNDGTIETASGATLIITDADLINTNGTVTVASNGTLDLTGSDTINNGTLDNLGTVDIGTALATTNVTIENENSGTTTGSFTNGGTVTVDAGSSLTLDNVYVANAGGSIIVDTGAASGATLTLIGTDTIDGGALTNQTAQDAINIGTALATATVTIENENTGADVFTNAGSVTIASGSTLTLTSEKVMNAGGTFTIDGGATPGTLTLNGATIVGGTINDYDATGGGSIVVTANSKLTGGATVNGNGTGTLTVDSGVVLATDGVQISNTSIADPGTVKVDTGQILTLTGNDSISGGIFAFNIGGVFETANYATNGAVSLPNLAIGDLAGTNPSVTLTVVLSGGSFVPNSTTNVTESGSGNQITFTGSLSDINAMLASGVVYTPAAGTTSNTMNFSVNDGALGDFANKQITITTPPISAGSAPSVQTTGATGAIRNSGEIDINGTTTLKSDTVFDGAATIVVAATTGLLQLDNTSIHGGSTGGTITDNGEIEVLHRSGLDKLTVTIAATGQVKIDSTEVLSLNSTALTGSGSGAVIDNGTSGSGATIQILGSSSIVDASLNYGTVVVSTNQTLTLGNETVTGTAFTDTANGAILAVQNAGTLTFSGVAVNGGTINDYDVNGGGNIVIAAASTFAGTSDVNPLLLHGNSLGSVTLDAGLTLDNVTLDGITIENGTSTALTFEGTVDFDGAASLNGLQVANTGATLLVDSGVTVTLNDTTVTGGTVTDNGHIVLNGTSTIDPGVLNLFGTLAIDGNGTLVGETVSNSGTLTVALADTLTMTDSALTDFVVTGTPPSATTAYGVMTIDSGGTLVFTDTLSNTDLIDGGQLNNQGAIDIGTVVSGTIITANVTIENETGANSLTVGTDRFTNGGMVTIEAGSQLTLDNVYVANAGGTFTIDGGVTPGTLTLNGTTINGGTINDYDATGGGHIVVAGNSAVTGGVTIDGNGTGTLTIDSGVVLTLDADTLTGLTLTGGTVDLDAATTTVSGLTTIGDATVQDGTLTIDSGVVLTLDADTLTGLTLTGGTVDLDAATTTVSGPTTIGDATVQDGTLTIDTGVVLTLDADTLTGLTLTGGTVDLDAATTTVSGLTTIGDATVQDGTLTIDSGVVLTLDADTLTGLTLTGGTVDLDAATTTTVSGSSTITGGATLNDGSFDLNARLRLDGTSGAITVNETAFTTEAGHALSIIGGVTLNGSTITDNGHVNVGSITLHAAGTLTVDDGTVFNGTGATGNNGTLTINTGSTLDVEHDSAVNGPDATLDGVVVTNRNQIELDLSGMVAATLLLDGGTTVTGGTLVFGQATDILDIEGPIGATLDNVDVSGGGAIEVGVTTTGATLTLDGGSTVTDGTMTLGASPGGVGTLDVEGAAGAALNGVTVTAAALADTIEIGQTGTAKLTLEGGASVAGGSVTIGGGGTLAVVKTGAPSSGDATLDGVAVTDSGAVTVGTTASGATLVLDDGTSIGGGGKLIINNASSTLDIEHVAGTAPDATLDGITVTNHGEIELDVITNPVTLLLDGGTTVTGGTLVFGQTADVLHIEGPTGATLDNVDLSGGGAIDIGVTTTGAVLTLDGGSTVTGGTISIASGSTLAVAGLPGAPDAILDGVTVTDLGAITIDPAASGATLLLDDGASISGQGIGTMTIDSSGTLDVEQGGGSGNHGATLDGLSLTDNNTSSTVPGIKVGVTSAATLVVDDDTAIQGSGTMLIGVKGTLDAEGATLSGLSVTNKGNIEVGVTTTGAVLTLTDLTVTNTGGSITVATGATLAFTDMTGSDTINGGALGNSGDIEIGTAGATASVTIENEKTGASIFTNAGTLTVNSGSTLTLTNDTVANATSGSINVDGTLDTGTATGSTVVISNGSLLVAGLLDVLNGTTTLNPTTLTNTGSITVESDATLVIDQSVSDGASPSASAGSFTVNGAATLEFGAGVMTDQGIKFTGSGGTLKIDGNPGSIGGNITIGSGDIVVLADSGVSGTPLAMNATGNLSGFATIDLTGSYDTLTVGSGNATVSVTGTNDTVVLSAGTDSVTLAANSDTVDAVIGTGATLIVGDKLTGAGQNTLSLTGSGSFDLNTITLTGFKTVDLGAHEAVTLNNLNLTVNGVSNDTVTLGSGTDTVTFASGSTNVVVNATATTFLVPVPLVTAPDSLIGGGTATLSLTGGGTIDLASLSTFTGFSTITEADTGAYALTLKAGQNGETINLSSPSSGYDSVIFTNKNESTPSHADTVTNFSTADKIDLSQISGINGTSTTVDAHGKIAPNTVYWVQNGSDTDVYVNTSSSSVLPSNSAMEIILKGVTASTLTGSNFVLTSVSASPAGIAGAPINLALADPAAAGTEITTTFASLPASWKVSGATENADGSWTVTGDPAALSVTTPAGFTGAAVLHVTETWTNADGSTGATVVADNVEAYAPGSPIFALSGADNLTGAGGDDMFVFAQPMGNDAVYNFSAATDRIDLVGFSQATRFGDLQIADDGHGDAVITVGTGESITLHGVDAASLSAANFVFNQTPVVDNTGTMTISDGATLPLGGTVDNTGTILLASAGNQSELQIAGGVTLEGGGHVLLSGDDAIIVGTAASDTLTNVDNTVDGTGQIGAGDGLLTVFNAAHGVIDADISGAVMALDTGNTIVNDGVLEASNGGILQIDDALSGAGKVLVAGGTVEINASSDQNVTFDNGPSGSSYGEVVLGAGASFTGQITGFAGSDAAHSDVIDVSGLNYGSLSVTETLDGSTDHLSLSDGSHTVDLALADFTGGVAFASDGHGGTVITGAPSVGAGSLEVDLAMNGASANDTITETVTAQGGTQGGNALHDISLGTAIGKDGSVSAALGFDFTSDQITLADGQTTTQLYNVTLADAQNPAANQTELVSVTIGGPGNDNFVFAPGIGSDTITNFNPHQDMLELDHFSNAQTVQELQSLITADSHGDAVIDLGHNDSITLAGVSTAELQKVIQAGHVLLH
jgi:hypothetical protein